MSVVISHEAMQVQKLVNHGNVKYDRLDPRTLMGEPSFIFNIYSSEVTVNLGTCGIWYIPPCPEGTDYVRAPQAIPGTYEEMYPHFTDGVEYRSRAVPGEDIVAGILAEDRPMESLPRLGIFASHNSIPTKQELVAAKKNLIPHLQQLIAQADKFYASPDPAERQSVYDDKFFRAARFLNVKKPWLSEASEMTMCPFCSIAVSPQASICSGCHQIIDQARFDAMKAQIGGAK
jgi:hypothetical protein